MNPKIVIIVRGGCVVAVKSSNQSEVQIIDVNDLRETSHPLTVETIIKEACEGLESVY